MRFANIQKSFTVKDAKAQSGTLVDERKRIIDMVEESEKNPSMFKGLSTKRRRGRRAKQNLDSMVSVVCDEELELPLSKSDLPIYIRDDTDGASTKLPASLPRFYYSLNVSDYKILDSDEITKLGVALKSADGQLIMYKLGRQQRSRVSMSQWRRYYDVLKLALKVQYRNNPRGIRKMGVFLRYILFGWRKDGNGTEVHEYAVPKETPKEAKDEKMSDEDEAELKTVKEGLKELIAHLEKMGLLWIPAKDISINNKLREDAKLQEVFINGKSGRFTQIAIATGYWSPIHIDDDIFYTLLSCFCPSVANAAQCEEILFYFIFPSVGYAIPIRNTDILVFNSAFPHCASNYRKEDAITFSLFASAKTATAHMSGKGDLFAESESDDDE